MRTTIEISDNIHLRLINEAALTGQHGFSGIVEQAIQQYFKYKGSSFARREAIENLYWSILEEDIDDQITIRRNWRTGRNLSEDMSENNS